MTGVQTCALRSPNGVIEGGLAIFAAGNESSAMAAYPSAYPEFVSVASLAADGTPSNFTNFGREITIAAPGGDGDYHKGEHGKILSTIPVDGKSGYGFMEGTSMACPAVSGVAALGLSYAVQQKKHFKANEFRQMIYQSCIPLGPYFTETKYYWINFDLFGEVSLGSMEPNNYRNKMGHGIINANNLFSLIDGNGVDMKVPNVYVALNNTTKLDLSRYFKDINIVTVFTCVIEDESIATVTIDGSIATFNGNETGSVKATATADNGISQSFVITVRKNAGNEIGRASCRERVGQYG